MKESKDTILIDTFLVQCCLSLSVLMDLFSFSLFDYTVSTLKCIP
jgi:hypothetical protein